MRRLNQGVLIASTLLGCWLGMQAVHEAGHALAACLTGGHVARVVLHPLTISRTDVDDNRAPLLVAWAGPVFGVLAPLLLWRLAATLRWPGAFVLRFFAGFCLIANGAYLAFGSLERAADCGVMLQHGSALWQLWSFGLVTVPVGLWLWHRQGPAFGLGPAAAPVDAGVAYGSLVVCVGLITLAFAVGGE